MAAQTLGGAVTSQVIERAQGRSTQARKGGGATGTAGQCPGHGTHSVGRAFDQGHRVTRVILAGPLFKPPWWAAAQDGGRGDRAKSTDGEGA
jgi:hypothetical protein